MAMAYSSRNKREVKSIKGGGSDVIEADRELRGLESAAVAPSGYVKASDRSQYLPTYHQT
jgi:hypothetical protein